jgi:hypothetical protein
MYCSIYLSTRLSKGIVFVMNLTFSMTPLGCEMILGILPRVQTIKLSMESNNQFSEVIFNYDWFCEMLVLKSRAYCYLNNVVNVTLCTFILEGVNHPGFKACW